MKTAVPNKALKPSEVEPKSARGEFGSISGYAATFGHEKPDSHGDVIAKGAFRDSIARIKAERRVIPLMWNHDSGNLTSYIGTVTSLSEDGYGLFFKADFDSTDEAQRARELVLDGRLCKFSFSYNVIDQRKVTLANGTRANELLKLEIHEISLVLYPANRDTMVVDVKQGRDELLAEAETALGKADDTIASYDQKKRQLLAQARELLAD